ncbi:MAG: protease inhibitor I42 family protein, partial [Chloroflexi bacterium]|nr:protease inhibitor I42 family protein [Chloroflexota bacterium]
MKTKRWILIERAATIALIIVLLAVGMSPASAAAPPRAPAAPERVVGLSDNGSLVRLAGGETLAVTLQGNPSTGYRWEVAQWDGRVLQPLDLDQIQPASPLLGAPAQQTLRFRAAGAGESALRLVYRRPWAGAETAPLAEFALQVVVQGSHPPLELQAAPKALPRLAPGQPMRLPFPGRLPTHELPEPLRAVDAEGWTTIATQDFEGIFPGPWLLADDDGLANGEYYWGRRTCRALNGASSGWAVGAGRHGSDLPCGSEPPNNNVSWMVYGPFSLQDAEAAELRFALWVDAEWGYDGLFWGASVDGEWFHGSAFSGYSFGWSEAALDLGDVPELGNLLGQPQVWVALVWMSDESITYPEGVY